MRGLTRDAWLAAGWSEEVGGGRNLVRKAAASGGPAPNGGHDSLNLGPPSRSASVPKVEEDAAEAMVALVGFGAAGLDGEVRRPEAGKNGGGWEFRVRVSRERGK